METDYIVLPLPDDGQLFLKPTAEMLRSELVRLSPENAEPAVAHFLAGDQALAEWRYREASDLYATAGRSTPSMSACLARGVALMMISELREALTLFDWGKMQAQRTGAQRFEAAFRINLGQVQSDLGNGQSCLKELIEALRIIREIDDGVLEALAINRLAVGCFLQGRYDTGREYCSSLQNWAQHWLDSMIYRDGLFARAILALAKGELRKAEEYILAGFEKGNTTLACHAVVRLYMQLAMLYLLGEKGSKAADVSSRAADICRRLSYPQGEARCVELQAEMFLRAGQDKRGFDHLSRAVELNCRAGYRRGEARTRLLWAKICLQRGQLEEARALNEEARALANQTGHKNLFLEAAALSILLAVERSTEEKVEGLFELLEISRISGLVGAEILILENLASMAIIMRRWNQAMDHLHLALAKSERMENRFEQAKIWALMAHLMEQKQEKELGTEYRAMSRSIMQDLGLERS